MSLLQEVSNARTRHKDSVGWRRQEIMIVE